MPGIKELYQQADWKQEKHVPVIDVPGKINKGESVTVTVAVGKEIPHPNKAEHHIAWIEVYFQPQGEKYPYHIGHADFAAHGESVKGPDTSGIYSQPEVLLKFKTEKPGTLYASSYCTIHGLWENSKTIEVE